MKRSFLKKVVLFLTVVLTLLSFAACTKKHEPVQPDTDPTKAVEDTSYTKDLTSEKEVAGGKVYLQDNMVIATMIIKDGVSAEDAKKLANEYAQKLRETYKDKPINVQAVQNGKNVANIVLEK